MLAATVDAVDFWLLLGSVPILILLNAFFVSGEYAVVAARPMHVESLRQRGWSRSAAALAALKGDPASAIGTIQVCITATNLALGWLGEPAMSRLLMMGLGGLATAIPAEIFRPISLVISFTVVTLLTVVFSELLPKALTLRYVMAAAVITAVPVLAISYLVRPLVRLMNGMANLVTLPLGLGRVETLEDEEVSVEELRLLATEAARGGTLTGFERSLITNALSLQKRRADRIMVPRMRVAFLDLTRSMQANREVLHDNLYSHFPLCNGGIDKVVGVVATKQFLTAFQAAGETRVLELIADTPLFAPENANVAQILSLMNRTRTQFVILVEEHGGTAGIVTMRDVMEDLMGMVDESKVVMKAALLGDLYLDGAPTEQSARQPRHESIRFIRGDLPVHELGRLLDRPYWSAENEAATVAGLIQLRLGEIGAIGDEVTVDGVRLRIAQSDGRTIQQVEVQDHVAADAAENGDPHGNQRSTSAARSG